jgi:hypothetical protein
MFDNKLLTSSDLQKFQQVDARSSTFNNVKRDQHNNVHITINNNYASNDKVVDTPVR